MTRQPRRRRSRRYHERRRLKRALERLLPQVVPGLTENTASEPARYLAALLIDSGWLRRHDEEVAAHGPLEHHD